MTLKTLHYTLVLQKIYFYFLIVLMTGFPLLVSAQTVEYRPIYINDQNPFVQIFGIPKPEAGSITSTNTTEVGLQYYVSNNSISGEAIDGETLTWDGETSVTSLVMRFGLTNNFELGIDLPHVTQSSGYLDAVVRRWHKIFGFPNDRQNEFLRDQFHYRYERDGEVVYELTDRHEGIGDIRVSAAIPLLRQTSPPTRELALRGNIKLPTGNEQYLLGSGGTDISVGLALSDYQLLSKLNTILISNIGVTHLGNSQFFQPYQKDYVAYASLALDWLAFDILELKVQLDYHSALYDSQLAQLGSGLQLTVGGTFTLPENMFLDLGMSQNTTTDAVPDVGFYGMFRQQF